MRRLIKNHGHIITQDEQENNERTDEFSMTQMGFMDERDNSSSF